MFRAILAAVLLAQAAPAATDSAPAAPAATTTPSTNLSGVKVNAARPLKLN